MIRAVLDNPLSAGLALLAGGAILAVGQRLGNLWLEVAGAIIKRYRPRRVWCPGSTSHDGHSYWAFNGARWRRCPVVGRERKAYLKSIGFTGKGRT